MAASNIRTMNMTLRVRAAEGAAAGQGAKVYGAAGNGDGSGAAGDAGGGSPFNQKPPEGHAKRTSEVLGEIVWLMSQSPLHKQYFISDLEWPAAEAAKRESR